MWRRKAVVIGVVWLTAGCAAIPDSRSGHQMAGVAAQTSAEVELEGCLLTGAAPGTFVLVVTTGELEGCLLTGAAPGTFVLVVTTGGRSNQSVDVMSTRIGLTAHVGRRLAVRGQEQAAPPRSIHDGARLFQIRSLDVVDTECRTSG